MRVGAGADGGGQSIKSAIIESIDGGNDYYLSQGKLTLVSLPNGHKINRIFGGWKNDEFGTDKLEV